MLGPSDVHMPSSLSFVAMSWAEWLQCYMSWAEWLQSWAVWFQLLVVLLAEEIACQIKPRIDLAADTVSWFLLAVG